MISICLVSYYNLTNSQASKLKKLRSQFSWRQEWQISEGKVMAFVWLFSTVHFQKLRSQLSGWQVRQISEGKIMAAGAVVSLVATKIIRLFSMFSGRNVTMANGSFFSAERILEWIFWGYFPINTTFCLKSYVAATKHQVLLKC